MESDVCFINQTISINDNNQIFFNTTISNIMNYLVIFLVFAISLTYMVLYSGRCDTNNNNSKNNNNCGDNSINIDKDNMSNRKIIRERFTKSCPPLHFSPSKTTEELNENDLLRIVDNENQCTESQEDPRSYGRGGYIPLLEGDILDDKYEVCRKLGYGQFSTVWLCQNQITNDYVAIKISKSILRLNTIAKEEIKLLQCTNTTNPEHPGYRNIVQMIDYFNCKSINGNHTAIVLEVMGPSLLHLIKQSEFRGIQIPGVRRIIKQVLQGLEYLHKECGIIHTDIKPENILIKAKEPYIRKMVTTAKKLAELNIALPKTYVTSERWTNAGGDLKTDDSDDDELYRGKSYPEDPFLSELISFRKTHGDAKLTEPMWVDVNIEVKIGDMGNATWVDQKYNSTIQTRQYRALEVILDAGYDCPADIWSVGCLAFELATGEYLFYPKSFNNWSLDFDHVTLIWETLGGIPKYITKRGAKASVFFSHGKLKFIKEQKLRLWKIEDVLVDKYKWKRVDAIPFAGFIEYLIEPDPSLRYTATAALSCDCIWGYLKIHHSIRRHLSTISPEYPIFCNPQFSPIFTRNQRVLAFHGLNWQFHVRIL